MRIDATDFGGGQEIVGRSTYIVLAEVAMSKVVDLLNHGGSLGLAHSKHQNL